MFGGVAVDLVELLWILGGVAVDFNWSCCGV